MKRLVLFTVFLSVIADTEQLNCSTYNPCGKNGYCHDNIQGEWTCECKFWWNGTVCDQQTNSGKEVITLSCVVGFLLILYYGLTIIRYIRNRRQKSKEINRKITIKGQTLINIAFKTIHQSIRLSSCIITILVIILATIALVSIWTIIQPIHTEIVYKYQTNQTLYYTQNSLCKIINLQNFNAITISVACFIIILFIIKTKRTTLCRDKCYGYGGLPIPVDFLTHIDRKFAAVVFAVISDELILILGKDLSRGTSNTNEGIIAYFLLRLLQVLIMGFRYYPLLAAVYIDSIFTLACATVYAWLDYALTIIDVGMCEADYYPTYNDYLNDGNSSSIVQKFEYYGTGENLIIIQLCTIIPKFLCLAYISVKLPGLLMKKIFDKFKKNMSIEKKILTQLTREQRTFFYINRFDSVEMHYVRNLFRPVDQRLPSQSIFARLIPKKIYEWRDDFRFSTRILCIYSSIFLLLYFVAIQAHIRVIPQLDGIQNKLQIYFNGISILLFSSSNINNNSDQTSTSDTSNFPVPSLIGPYLFAVYSSLIIIIIQLLVLLVNIRRNLFQLFRGDDSEIPRRQRSDYILLSSGNIHFAGYFIGYLIWGFILIAAFVCIICVCIAAFISSGTVRFIELIVKNIIPSILIVLCKYYINQILIQYVFLQHHGEVLSLNNRRILLIFLYFNFFFDAFLGFISSIVRLITSVIAGIFYMCRLDYSPLGRKLETMDGGFSSYCGFIHTECVHRHPVMLVFVSHLYTQLKIKQLTIENMNIDDIKQLKISSRYIRKWKLAVFLIQNPTIVFFRKIFLKQLHNNRQQQISIYTRRMSTTQLSINTDSIIEHFQNRRF